MTSMFDSSEFSAPAAQQPPPDAHGQAGLLLAESILHSLVASGSWTTAQAVEAIEVAADVKLDMVGTEPNETIRHSLALLAGIASSLKADAI